MSIFLQQNWSIESKSCHVENFVEHSRLTSDSIFYLGAITCFVYPIANRTLLLQERTGHWSGATAGRNALFTQSLFFSFVRHFDFSSGLPLYTRSQTPVPSSPFPVPRSPFPILVTSQMWRQRLRSTDWKSSFSVKATFGFSYVLFVTVVALYR